MAWLFLTIGGVLAGQMIYRWKKDIILTTVVTVVIAMARDRLGTSRLPTKSSVMPSPTAGGCGRSRRSSSATLLRSCPSGGFALPINYVAAYIVFLGLLLRNHRDLHPAPELHAAAYTKFQIRIGSLWPIMFVTIACGAISGWHSIVSSSGTARQLESELDARPVRRGCHVPGDDAGPLRPDHCGTLYRLASRITRALWPKDRAASLRRVSASSSTRWACRWHTARPTAA